MSHCFRYCSPQTTTNGTPEHLLVKLMNLDWDMVSTIHTQVPVSYACPSSDHTDYDKHRQTHAD